MSDKTSDEIKPRRVPALAEIKDALRERFGRDLAGAVRSRLCEGAGGLDLEDRAPDAAITIRLDEESELALEAICEASGLSRNEVFLRVFDDLLRR